MRAEVTYEALNTSTDMYEYKHSEDSLATVVKSIGAEYHEDYTKCLADLQSRIRMKGDTYHQPRLGSGRRISGGKIVAVDICIMMSS